ncbi:ABC transporter ATP-binding protein [Methanolobus bombayensis]|uniref:ABC transporter ATP-binding protein n=1 Tax=Methanolobus bombayensis TaxID=38023 RepID=UPI003158B74B|nr:NitT/TauT family transport system ATP-binding protein [Methanolobus bombayensis]
MKRTDLSANNISKCFLQPGEDRLLYVLEDMDFEIKEGEFVTILGPSGCGKSTFLNILAGFETANQGQTFCCGEPIKGPSPERAVVFQSPVLFPWMDVKSNIMYGLKQVGKKKGEAQKITAEYISAVGLEGFENYYPCQLSGGMQQRVALARSLILNPKVLLMDEPFAALDAQTRYSMQQLLLRLWESNRQTIVFITHDVEEALLLSDRICIMSKRPGRIIEEISVPFEWPRPISLTGSGDFSQLKSHILSILLD